MKSQQGMSRGWAEMRTFNTNEKRVSDTRNYQNVYNLTDTWPSRTAEGIHDLQYIRDLNSEVHLSIRARFIAQIESCTCSMSKCSSDLSCLEWGVAQIAGEKKIAQIVGDFLGGFLCGFGNPRLLESSITLSGSLILKAPSRGLRRLRYC